ncbi:MAG TPA: DUF1707 domain-containing protein [Chloroflexota bacterium]|jgi:hypothetical protein|nr:DUF1707 domain-containing protein [Chloroflexota bacterium]
MDMDRIAHYDEHHGSDARIADVRASDADRAVTAELLQRHYAAGRLETQEFEERVGRCYAAKTLVELWDLVVDLPRTEVRDLEPSHPGAGRRPVWWTAPVLLTAVALVTVFSLTGAHALWLAWPLAFFVLRARLWRRWWGISW